MYRQQDFANVPKNRRRATVELQLPVWSPFRRTGHHCVWSDTTAMVWFWDEDRVREARQAFRTAPATRDTPVPEDLRVVPETVFLPRGSDGVRLQRCRAGTELQHWRDGVLQDTFWFAEPPAAADVTASPGAPGHRGHRPHRKRRRRHHPARIRPQNPGRAPSPPPSGWSRTNARWPSRACSSSPSPSSGRKPASGRWTASRTPPPPSSNAARTRCSPSWPRGNEIVALRRRNEAFVTLLNAPSQARIMGLVDGAIPGDSARFAEWRYQQGELEVLVSDAQDLDPVAYVRALEAVPLFEAVRVGRSTRPDSVEIGLRVRP